MFCGTTQTCSDVVYTFLLSIGCIELSVHICSNFIKAFPHLWKIIKSDAHKGGGDREAIAIYIATTFNFEHVNNIANVLYCTDRALIAKMGGVGGGREGEG